MRKSARQALNTLALAATSAAALTGCGDGNGNSDGGSPAATVTVTATVTASPSSGDTAEPDATTSPAQTLPAQAPNVGDHALNVGQWREGLDIRTRVTKFYQPAAAPKPSYLAGEADGDGAIARIEMCTRDGSNTTKGDIYGLFMAYDDAGGQYTQSSSTWGEWPPLPQLPSEVSITPGKCLSGWVLISAPKNTKLVTFDMSDGEGGSIAQWKVG